jgi:hypothetical protein
MGHLEETVAIAFVDADPRVPNLDHDLVGFVFVVEHVHAHVPTLRRELDRVGDQVVQDLTEPSKEKERKRKRIGGMDFDSTSE